MTKKTLLVLAASPYQIPTISTAKQLGYRVITTDNIPNNPGHTLADKSYFIDTTDLTAILNLARQEKIDGIIAPCTDVAVPTAAYVAEKLGLPGVPFDSTKIVCNKLNFRQFMQQQGLPNPLYYQIIDKTKLSASLFQFPWILKPDFSSGSKGIFIVNSFQEFQYFLTRTLSFSPNKRGIIECFIQGFQGTCEGIIKDGDLALSFFLDRQTASPPYVATHGHYFPSILSNHLKQKLLNYLKIIWSELGIKNGCFDCDFVATENEVYILELSPRMGGNSIAKLLKIATKFDLVEYAIKQACGDYFSVPILTNKQPTGLLLLGVNQQGSLVYNSIELEKLSQESWIKSLQLDVSFGDQVFPFINGRYRLGETTISADSRSELEKKVQEFQQRLQLGVK